MTLVRNFVPFCGAPRVHLGKLAVALAATWIPNVVPAKQLTCTQVSTIVNLAMDQEQRYRVAGGGHVVKLGSDPLNEQAMQSALDRFDSHMSKGIDRHKARDLTAKELVDECYKANPLPPGARRVSDPKPPRPSKEQQAAERQASEERRLAAKERRRAAKEARRTGQPEP